MNQTRRMFLIAALIVAMPFSLAAQEAGQESASQSTDLPRSPAPEDVTLTFANLADGQLVPPTFEVVFEITGMDISPAGTQAENSGHHHLLIDVLELPPINLPLPKTDNIVHFGDGATGANVTLPPGDHTLQLIFADHLHIPHDPPVMSEKITVTVSRDTY